MQNTPHLGATKIEHKKVKKEEARCALPSQPELGGALKSHGRPGGIAPRPVTLEVHGETYAVNYAPGRYPASDVHGEN